MGGVILAGGASARMGADKAALDWDGEPLVRRVARVVRDAVDGPVVVVGGADGAVPDAGPGVERAHDRTPGLGPLEGLRAGLAALDGRSSVAVVCSVDLPHLVPEALTALLGLLREEDDAVVPVAHGHRHPLTAVYRVALHRHAAELLDAGERRLGLVLERSRTRLVTADELLADAALRAVDPMLRCLVDVDTPEELADARDTTPGAA